MIAFICTVVCVGVASTPPDRIVAQLAVIQASDADRGAAEAVFEKVVAELDATFVPPVEAQAALGGRKCSASAEVDVCLADLARATRAQAALLLVASLQTPEIVLTGRLVAHNGEVVAPPSTRRYPNAAGAGRGAALESALRSYFHHELALGDLDAPLTPNADAIAVRDGQPDSPDGQRHPLPRPAHRTMRWGSYLLLGAGLTSLAVGGTVWLTGGPDRTALQGRLDEHRRLRPGDPQALTLQDSLAERARLSALLGVAGVVSSAVGGALFMLSRTTESPVGAGASLYPGAPASRSMGDSRSHP